MHCGPAPTSSPRTICAVPRQASRCRRWPRACSGGRHPWRCKRVRGPAAARSRTSRRGRRSVRRRVRRLCVIARPRPALPEEGRERPRLGGADGAQRLPRRALVRGGPGGDPRARAHRRRAHHRRSLLVPDLASSLHEPLRRAELHGVGDDALLAPLAAEVRLPGAGRARLRGGAGGHGRGDARLRAGDRAARPRPAELLDPDPRGDALRLVRAVHAGRGGRAPLPRPRRDLERAARPRAGGGRRRAARARRRSAAAHRGALRDGAFVRAPDPLPPPPRGSSSTRSRRSTSSIRRRASR